MNNTMLALFGSHGLTPDNHMPTSANHSLTPNERNFSPASYSPPPTGHGLTPISHNPLPADCNLVSNSYSQTITARALAQINQSLARNELQLSLQAIATLQEERAETLVELERIEIGAGPLPAIVDSLASSPFLFQTNLAESLACIQRLFYQLRDEIPVDVPDDELAEALRICFDQLEGDLEEFEALSAQDVLAASPETMREREQIQIQSKNQGQEATCVRELRHEREPDDYWPQTADHANDSDAYRICDENGHEYVFQPANECEDAGLFFMQNSNMCKEPIYNLGKWMHEPEEWMRNLKNGLHDSEEWAYDEFADGWDGEKWSDDLD